MKRVVFVRSSLGLRGGDVLALDLARAAEAAGAQVEFVIDRVQAFAPPSGFRVRETHTRLPATLGGLRRNFIERLRLWSIVRRGTRGLAAPDLFVVDESAVPAVWLKQRFPRTRVLFYCNFPAVPITPARGGLHAWYRRRSAAFNDRALAACDEIAVLSKFSQDACRRTWPQLQTREIPVLYPGTDLPTATAADGTGDTFLAIARFIPEKRLDVAVEAFARLLGRAGADANAARLALVGGHDARDPRQAEVVASLRALAAARGVADRVELHFNVPADALAKIWQRTVALLHPAPEEHFGYTPIEAMARGRPALAVAAGGPAETIRDGVTGALRPLDVEAFAAVLADWWTDRALVARLGAAGRAHVTEHFSRERFNREAMALLRRVAAIAR